MWPDSGKKRGYGYIEFDDEDAASVHILSLNQQHCYNAIICCIPLITEYLQVDKIVLVGIHIIGNCRLEARKGLSKEQQEAIRFVSVPSLYVYSAQQVLQIFLCLELT